MYGNIKYLAKFSLWSVSYTSRVGTNCTAIINDIHIFIVINFSQIYYDQIIISCTSLA